MRESINRNYWSINIPISKIISEWETSLSHRLKNLPGSHLGLKELGLSFKIRKLKLKLKSICPFLKIRSFHLRSPSINGGQSCLRKFVLSKCTSMELKMEESVTVLMNILSSLREFTDWIRLATSVNPKDSWSSSKQSEPSANYHRNTAYFPQIFTKWESMTKARSESG